MPGITGGGGLGPRYARLWAASTVSNLGDGITLVAIPLLAASLTRDPFLVAVVAAAGQLPWLLFSLHAGAFVDRVDRRRLMVAVDLARAGVVAALAATVLTGVASLPLLAAVAFLQGSGEVLYANAVQPLIPALTGGRDLERANARLYAGEILTNRFLGGPVGGLLFAAAAALPFAVDAATFLASAALLAGIAGTYRPERAAGPPTTLRAEIGEGLRWLWRHSLLRFLALVLGVFNLAGAAAAAVYVLFALEELGLGEAEVGFLLIAGAVGALAGTALAARLSRRLGPGRAMLGAGLLGGVAMTGLAVTSSPWVAALLGALEGVFVIVWNVITISLRQEIIPDRLLGRVSSSYRLVGVGAAPVGALLGGAVASALGLRATFLVFGALTLLVSLLLPLQAGDAQIARARSAASAGPGAPAPAAPA
ncbi:MAG: MFS transporter [Thermoleophilia bacterium]|jgi:MFS family permease|nr:MFS transporter [Thermoleophilia bacterium]